MSDHVDIDEARYLNLLSRESCYLDAYDAVVAEMQLDCAEALKGSSCGVKYAKRIIDTTVVLRRDPLEIFESMLEKSDVGDAFFDLMKTPAAQKFIRAFCDEYAARFAECVVDAGVRK